MNKGIKNITVSMVDFLKSIRNRRCVEKNGYRALTPIDVSDKYHYKEYAKALDAALLDKRILNIAVTGSYGSGKSSFLKTYSNNNKHKLFHRNRFLFISLANYSTKYNPDKNKIEPPEENKIEANLIQQLFYQVNGAKIPSSRVKKKNDPNWLNWILVMGVLFLLFISILFLFNKDFLLNLFPFLIEIKKRVSFYPKRMDYYASGIVIICATIVSRYIYMFFKNVKISLSLKEFGVEIAKEANDSTINKYLEEILYFFEKTKYNVLVIEDLDRFNSTYIFSKLKEVNQLINSNGRRVVFVYALRDDLFESRENRTKFFDFIIPIVPVVNHSNARDVIVKANDQLFNGELSTDLINVVSPYLDDMRLLNSIINDYAILRPLYNNLDADKLFAMIVYKNYELHDFQELLKRKGYLYSIVRPERKEEEVNSKVKELEQKIKEFKQKIHESKLEKDKRIERLRREYVNQSIVLSKRHGKLFINNNTIDIDEIVNNDDFFGQYQQGKVSYGESWDHRNISIKDAEKSIGEEYEVGQNRIADFYSIDSYKREISKLEKAIISIRNTPLSNVVHLEASTDEYGKVKPVSLTNRLVLSGYIDEHYLDYVTIFIDGELSREESDFKNMLSIDLTYIPDRKIVHVESLLQRIPEIDLTCIGMLNFDLVSGMLDNLKSHLHKFRTLFGVKNRTSLVFIYDYLSNTETRHKDKFIDNIIDDWPDFWLDTHILEKQSKEHLFRLILSYGDIDRICNLFNKGDILFSRFETLAKINRPAQEISEILATLGIEVEQIHTDANCAKDSEIDIIHSNDTLWEEICRKELFALNPIMCRCIMQTMTDNYSHNQFIAKNFTYISNSSCECLKSKIKNNFETYLKDVLLALDQEKWEEGEYYLSIINNSEVADDIKKNILEKIRTKISDITTISEKEMTAEIILKEYFKLSWHNIITIMGEDDLKKVFISSLTNFKRYHIYRRADDVIDPMVVLELLRNESVPLEFNEKMLHSYGEAVEPTNAHPISRQSAELLLDQRMVKVTEDSICYYGDCHFELFDRMVSMDFEKFIEFLHEETIACTKTEIQQLLTSSIIFKNQKARLVNVISEKMVMEITSEQPYYEIVVGLKIDHSELVKDDLIYKITEQYETMSLRNETLDILLNSKKIQPQTKLLLVSRNEKKIAKNQYAELIRQIPSNHFYHHLRCVTQNRTQATIDLGHLGFQENLRLLGKMKSDGVIKDFMGKDNSSLVLIKI
ncbi:MAG: hypothetical protein KBT28_04165 [Bacteroidales bacterium]|nr:hypothetical protein [Candidatus Colimorpha merdihippi]